MALQIRRGTDSERQSITPVTGELIYTTDTRKVYVGDGATQGGVPLSTVNSFQNISVPGQSPFVAGSSTDTLTFIPGNNIVITTTPGSKSLTISANLDRVTGDINGSVFADDSTLLVDGANAQIPAEVVKGTFTGSVIGSIQGNVTGNLTGNVFGDVTGNVNGNVSGSAATVTGAAQPAITSVGNLSNLTVVGDVSATNVSANIFTTSIDSADSSAIVITPAVIANSDLSVGNILSVSGEIRGNLLGSVTGTVTGNVIGDVTSNLVSSLVVETPVINGVSTGGGELVTSFNNSVVVSGFADFYGETSFTSPAYIKSSLQVLTPNDPDPATIHANIDINKAEFNIPVQFGQFSDTELSALVAAGYVRAGTIVWNTTSSQFMGYNGTAWVSFNTTILP